MKTRIFTLLMSLLAFVWSAKADEITSMTLTISFNGGDYFEVPFPAQGWPDLDITDEPATSIRIKKVEVQTSGTVSNVVFKATMYKTEKGLQPDDDWRTFDLPRQGNTWVLDFGDEAPDLIDSEMGPAPRTFQFFVQAQDGSGKAIYYNNGGQDYKVLFVNGGGSSSSGDIKNLTLTIRLNGGEAFTQDIPAENFPIVDLTDERTTSLIIVKVEVEAEESVSDLQFNGTMYSASEGSPSNDDEWRSYSLQNKGNGKWELDMGEGFELVEPDWLNKPKTKTFEFYVQGTNGSGSQLFYNNGGANYKVTFSTGESTDWKIKFLDGITAGLTFSLDGEDRVYNFNGAGDRVPEDQLGQLSSLCIDQFALLFYKAEGVKTNDVSLQYRVYEEGQEPEGGWSRINATHLDQEGGNQMFCYTDIVGINVTNGLEPNKDYVLEVNYQVVVGEEYFFLGKNKESSKFRFSLLEGGQGGSINSMSLTISQNGGEPFQVDFPSQDWDELVLEGQVNSLKILRAKVEADESVQNIAFVATMYTAGSAPNGDEWRTMGLNYQGGGYWLLDMGEGVELVENKWISENKTKTFEFYVQGQDASYNNVYYNNDGQNYKVTFTCGEGGGGPSTNGIKSFKLTINCDGELFTVSFPASGWPAQVIDGQTSSIKIMRAEVMTDESMSYVGLCSTIYDTADGWQHDDSAWDWAPLEGMGGGRWVLDYGEGRELIDSEWLTNSKTKTLEFFVGAGDYNGNEYQYANGLSEYGYNNNYKVTFTTGNGGDNPDWKIKFNDDVTAVLYLNVNGESLNYGFDKNGNRIPEQQMFSDVYSLTIDGFMLMFQYNTGVVAKDISLQYKVYEEGQEGMWNRINAQMTYPLNEGQMYSAANGLGINVAGLEFGKNYVLEIAYQIVTADNDYFFLGRDKESTKFRFYYDSETGIKTFSSSLKDEKAYNLAGQRVGKDYKGIVVTKGRKVLVK